MPGFTTHYIFGMKAYNDMPFTPLKHTIAKYRWLYQLGLQGPDMFFYNIPILRHRDYRNVGSYMHEHKVNAFFECCLRRIGTIRSRQQQEEAISYLAGFINHYIADSICHPYVYGRIGYPVDAPTSMHHGMHAHLENELDAILLWKFKHKKPSEFNQAATICLNGQEIQFLSRFLSRCINETYYPITERNIFQVTEGMVTRSVYAIRSGDGAPLHLGAALRLPDTLGQERQEKIRHCTGRIHLRQPPSCFRENGNGLRNRLPEQL